MAPQTWCLWLIKNEGIIGWCAWYSFILFGSGGGRTFAEKFAMYRGLNRVNVFVDL